MNTSAETEFKKIIRLLIVDDHEVVRRGLSLVLSQEPDFVIVGEAQDGIEAISMVIDTVPDVILLDWKMPRMDGLSAAMEIRRQMATSRILMLSGAPIEDAVLDTLDQGVDGFVNKDISPQSLAHAVRIVASGKPYLGPEITQALIDRSRQDTNQARESPPLLSKREEEVLNLMATPATYRQIGEQLYISEETVRTYVKRILIKMQQPNRTQAVIAGLRFKIIDWE